MTREEKELIEIGNGIIKKHDELISLWNENVLDDITPEWRKAQIRKAFGKN